MKFFRSRYVPAPPIDWKFLIKGVIAVPIGFLYGGAFGAIDMFLIYCVVGFFCLMIAGATTEEFIPEAHRQNPEYRWLAYVCTICIFFTLTWLVALNQYDPWRHLRPFTCLVVPTVMGVRWALGRKEKNNDNTN